MEKPNRRLSRRLPPETENLHVEKKKCVFFGLSGGAGTTTLALAFAAFLASRKAASPRGHATVKHSRTDSSLMIGFAEISDDNRPLSGYTFDRIGIDKRFAGRDYVSYYKLLAEGNTVRNVANPDSGINWALRIPGERIKPLSTADFVRLMDNVRGDSAVYDISGAFGNVCETDDVREETLRCVLSDADVIAAVVDPLPSALMADAMRFEMVRALETSGIRVAWIVNKMNRGVDGKELARFLRTKNIITVPALSLDDIYASEYRCETVFEMPRAAELLRPSFEMLEKFM